MSAQSDQEPSAPIGQFNTKSSSTPKGHNNAVRHYDNFVNTQNNLFRQNNVTEADGVTIKKYPLFNDLTEEFVCGRVLENGSIATDTPPIAAVISELTEYLFNVDKSNGDPYAPLSRALHLSQFKAALFDKFKPLSYGNQGEPQWYNELYRGLKLRASALCIKMGGTISKKHTGFPKKVLADCVKYLLKRYQDGTGYEERAVLVMLFHCVGRSSEVAVTTWESARWDEERQMLEFDWGELKVGQQYIMTLHPSADVEDGWVLDSFHSLACYLLCAPRKYKASASSEETGINFMFPPYVNMADGGCAAKVGRMIEKCREGGEVEGIPDDLTSHGLRVAAADEMMFNVYLPFFAAIARGGWDCKADTLLFYYLTLKLHMATAGKALAGWADPTKPAVAPTLEAIYDDSNRDVIDNFCHELFQNSPISALLSDPKKLKGFRSRMVASLLMYYTNVKKTLGIDCDIIKTVRHKWIDVGLNPGDLEKYGDKIKERFLIDNATSLAAGCGTREEQLEKAVVELQKIAVTNAAATSRLENKVDSMKEGMSEMTEMLYQLLDLQQSSSPSSGQKRRKPDASSTASTSAAESSTTAVRSVTQALFRGQQLQDSSVDWEQLGTWDCDKLLKLCLQNKEDFDHDHFLRGKLASSSGNRTKKSRAKAVLKELKRVAVEEHSANEMYFHYRYVPTRDKMEDRNNYFENVGKFAKKWTTTAKNGWYDDYKSKNNIPDSGEEYNKYIKKRNNQGMNVGALGSFLEDLKRKRGS